MRISMTFMVPGDHLWISVRNHEWFKLQLVLKTACFSFPCSWRIWIWKPDTILDFGFQIKERAWFTLGWLVADRIKASGWAQNQGSFWCLPDLHTKMAGGGKPLLVWNRLLLLAVPAQPAFPNTWQQPLAALPAEFWLIHMWINTDNSQGTTLTDLLWPQKMFSIVWIRQFSYYRIVLGPDSSDTAENVCYY